MKKYTPIPQYNFDFAKDILVGDYVNFRLVATGEFSVGKIVKIITLDKFCQVTKPIVVINGYDDEFHTAYLSECSHATEYDKKRAQKIANKKKS